MYRRSEDGGNLVRFVKYKTSNPNPQNLHTFQKSKELDDQNLNRPFD